MMISYKARYIYFDLWFSYSYTYDVSNLSILIGRQTKDQRKESWLELGLKQISKESELLYKTVAQKWWLTWELFNFIHKIVWLSFILNSVVSFAYNCYEGNSLVKANMVSTRKKKQSNRGLLNQLDNFDHDVILGDATNNGEQML